MSAPSETPPPTAGGEEIELKLRASPEALDRLLRHPAITARQRGRGASRRLDNRYFDTADGHLAGKRYALRVRRIGRKHWLTLKGPADPKRSPLARGEWEVPLPDDRPRIDLLPADGPLAGLGPILPEELLPVHGSEIRRRARHLDWREEDGTTAEIEAAFDDGRLIAGDRAAPVAELELELVAGPPLALYRLALLLHGIEPLRIETRSKTERARALGDDAPPPWQRAERLALRREHSVSAAFETILRHCYAQALGNIAAAEDGRDPEGVHQLRVALRRLRSALALFAPVLADEHRDWLGGEAKWLADALGSARDWDVFLAELLAPVAAATPADPALAALADAARREQARGYDRAREALAAPRATRLLLDLGAWIEEGGWRHGVAGPAAKALDSPVRDFADTLLDRLYRKARKRGRGFAGLPAEERHRVRIALKKLRYAVEFFLALYPEKSGRRFRKALADLQDRLGHLNDVTVARALLDRLAPEPDAPETAETLRHAAGLVVGWHGRGLADGEPETRAAWAEFVAAKRFWRT